MKSAEVTVSCWTEQLSIHCTGIAVLVNRVNKPKVTVAVDGSLYRFHPHFHQLMMKMTKALIKPGIDVSFAYHF